MGSEIQFSDFNFENSTISDFIDYLDFIEPERCYICINEDSKRLKKIFDYIQQEIDCGFYIFCKKSIGDSKLGLELLKNITFDKTIDIDDLYKKSFFSIYSGIYNFTENIHIKHIIIDKMEDINIIDKSIFINTGFNSLIICKNLESKNFKMNEFVFSKLISEDLFLDTIDINVNFVSIKKEKQLNDIENFISNRVVSDFNGMPMDIGKYLLNKKLFSIFIRNSAIYYDINKKIKLSNDLSTNVFSLLNELKKIDENKRSVQLRSTYINCFLISEFLEDKKIKFITKYNDRKLDSISEDNEIYTDWIGCYTNKKYYLCNITKQRIFEVNKSFIDIFEYIIKNKESDIANKEETILEAKELLNSVK